ncbi:MAG: TatD family hydrolase [Oscillospiraceae bacterium]|jgi:TatD DNase family protein|nr:TatD family hydrolase [Oscillospiraceae bacterium]
MIFDSHAHYDDSAFDPDRTDLLNSLPVHDVCGVINVGSDLISSINSVELSEKFNYFYAAIGVHPQNTGDIEKNYLFEFQKILQEHKVVAIGEIGLDYHGNDVDSELQKKVFIDQIIFAKENNLPVIVHSRDSSKDVLEILLKYKPRGVVHCFSGNYNFASDLIDFGFLIGVGGMITFKNSSNLAKVISRIPIEKILLETDAPYLAPVPCRGKRCDSSMIKFTAKKLSEIKGIDYEKILEVTENNVLEFINH